MLAVIMMVQDEQERNKVEQIYTVLQPMFYIAKGILHDEHLAEDAVLQTFIRIINNIDKIEK